MGIGKALVEEFVSECRTQEFSPASSIEIFIAGSCCCGRGRPRKDRAQGRPLLGQSAQNKYTRRFGAARPENKVERDAGASRCGRCMKCGCGNMRGIDR